MHVLVDVRGHSTIKHQVGSTEPVGHIGQHETNNRRDIFGPARAVINRQIFLGSFAKRFLEVGMMGVSTGPGLTALIRIPRSRQVQRFFIVQTTSASLLKK